MNNFNCTGNLGSDAEVKQAGQSTLCTFSLAVKSGFGDRAKTLWLRASIWGKQAEGRLPQFLSKGTEVAVSGELSLNEWTNKDGQNKTTVEIRVVNIDLVGGMKEPVQRAEPQSTPGTSDVPF